MRYAKLVEASQITSEATTSDASLRSIDIRLMLSYAVVTVLLVIAIFVFSLPYEPDPSLFMSNLPLP